MKKIIATLAIISLLVFSVNAKTKKAELNIVHSSELEWSPLNPARGNNSPQAANLWGDRKTESATGFVVKFKDGFSSPPHIHNVSYRAIVISGTIHNDDPKAASMWMQPGSFWTQPAGEVHITAAQGKENIGYVEIDNGPYLVLPLKEAFDNGEKPVNIDKSNIIWMDNTMSKFIKVKKGIESPKVAALWTKNQNKGYFLQLPKGFKGEVIFEGNENKVVILKGEVNITNEAPISLDAKSAFTSNEGSVSLSSSTSAKLYIRTNANFCVSAK